jgi:hypothetical protein
MLSVVVISKLFSYLIEPGETGNHSYKEAE